VTTSDQLVSLYRTGQRALG